MNIILASASPRRKEIMERAGFHFTVFPTEVDEELQNGLETCEQVKLLALKKAQKAASNFENDLVIGADTLVELEGEILSKPSDKEEAQKMLLALSGKTHNVYTGIAVIKKDLKICDVVKTQVTFRPLTMEEITEYIETGEPFDKAGAYGIQERGCLLVKEIKGDYFNVMGLPISRLNEILKELKMKN